MMPTNQILIHESRNGKPSWLWVSGIYLLKLLIIIFSKFVPGSIYRPPAPLPHDSLTLPLRLRLSQVARRLPLPFLDSARR
jgi:hypothetical protein